MKKDKLIFYVLTLVLVGVVIAGVLDMNAIYKKGLYTLDKDSITIETKAQTKSYYLTLDSNKLYVDKETYDSINWGTEYRIKYVWNGLIFKGYGDIIQIEPNISTNKG